MDNTNVREPIKKGPIDKRIDKPSSEFVLFCENKKYLYEKFYPHLNSIQRHHLLKQEFEKMKRYEQNS